MLKRYAATLLRTTLTALLLFVVATQATAQVYYNGRGPMGGKWDQIKSPSYKLVYPRYFAPTAIKLSSFLDSITPYINYGFSTKPDRIPIVLHTHSQLSNGEVVWAPKRMELITTAPVSTYADPWLKQLSVHESRHTVQITAVRKGLTRIASILFGQAGVGLGLLCIPDWFLEGDATMAETQFSEFGRGMQPSMSVDLRAMLMDSTRRLTLTDGWVCGSFRDYIPNIYVMGYQLVAAGERRFGPEMWGRAVEYSGKYPILIIPMRIYLQREAKIGITPMINTMMSNLREWWAPHSAVPNNYSIIGKHGRSHVTYGPPLIDPQGRVITTRSDYDTPVEWVAIDTATKTEKHLKWGTTPSSRPIMSGSKMYWTEYKPHPIWEYKSFSIVREWDLTTGKRSILGRRQNNYFITPMSGGRFAMVTPDSLGGSDVIMRDSAFRITDRMQLSELTSLHGLTWDSTTNTLAMIVLDDSGMWLGATTPNKGTIGELRALTDPSMVSISGLTSSCGALYFSSIASGKDEIHTLSLHNGIEQRVTTSSLGAYSPSACDSTIVFNGYTTKGLMTGIISANDGAADTIHWSRLPRNTLNLPNVKWNVPKMSTLSMTDTTTTHPKKRYNKALRWFNVHSWAPVALSVDKLINERALNMGFGASVLFQSVLGDSHGSASYGWLNNSNWIQGSFTYAGLPVQIGIDAEYGGGKQSVYFPLNNQADAMAKLDGSENYASFSVNLSMPLNFSSGANLRLLQPSFTMTHFNSLMYNSSTQGFDRGYQKVNYSLWWSNNRRSSLRSVVPRLGYALRADVSGAFGSRFGMVYSLYARGYVPGIMRNHSITMRLGGMLQTRAELYFTQKPLLPRGTENSYAARHYAAASLDYTMPVAYPDWGYNGLIYIKRIWVNLFADGSAGDYFAPNYTTDVLKKYSYGGDVAFDINFFGYSTPVTLKFTLAAPSDKRFFVGFGVAFNF